MRLPWVMRYIADGCQNEATVAENLKKWRMEYEKRGYDLLAAIHKKERCLIGFCGLVERQLNSEQYTEIAYRLSKRYWGGGLATEMASAMRDHAFKVHGFNSLIAIIHQQNTTSQKVALKMGMNFVKHDLYKGVAVNIYGSCHKIHYLPQRILKIFELA